MYVESGMGLRGLQGSRDEAVILQAGDQCLQLAHSSEQNEHQPINN
jgi:hypothetical protein